MEVTLAVMKQTLHRVNHAVDVGRTDITGSQALLEIQKYVYGDVTHTKVADGSNETGD